MLLCSPKGLMPSTLKPNHTFLASRAKSTQYSLTLDFSPLRLVSGCSQLPVFLTVLTVPSHQLGMLFASEQTFQPWYYRSIPHHVGRNPLPGALAVNITRVISSHLIPQCIAYRACVQNLVRTTAEDAVIRACMYLLHLQS